MNQWTKLCKGGKNNDHVIDSIQLESIINNFELGKPSGVDGLTVEYTFGLLTPMFCYSL